MALTAHADQDGVFGSNGVDRTHADEESLFGSNGVGRVQTDEDTLFGSDGVGGEIVVAGSGADSVEDHRRLALLAGLARQVQVTDVDAVLGSIRASEKLGAQQAFTLLWAVHNQDDRDVFRTIPIQKTASPIKSNARVTHVLVGRTLSARLDALRLSSAAESFSAASRACSPPARETAAAQLPESRASVSVVFQSVVNSRVWWSPMFPHIGVASRFMGPRKRGLRVPTAAEAEQFKGTLFTPVVRRCPPGDDAGLEGGTAEISSQHPAYETAGNVSLLQYWPAPRSAPPSPTTAASSRVAKRSAVHLLSAPVLFPGDSAAIMRAGAASGMGMMGGPNHPPPSTKPRTVSYAPQGPIPNLGYRPQHAQTQLHPSHYQHQAYHQHTQQHTYHQQHHGHHENEAAL